MPLPSLIKAYDSNIQVHWAVSSSLAPVVRLHGDVDEVIPVDERAFYSSRWRDRFHEIRRLRTLFKGYDRILIGHRSLFYDIAFFGFSKSLLTRYQILNSQKYVYTPPVELHESLALEKLVRVSLCIPDEVLSPKVSLPLELSFDLPMNYGLLHFGGGKNFKTKFDLKAWPYGNSLINLLLQKEKKLVLVGTREESDDLTNFTHPGVINLIGKTNVLELLAVIQRARFMVGTDSGPLHWADLFGISSLGLYGPTSVHSWGLTNANSKVLKLQYSCQPCYKDDGNFPPCPYSWRCMVDLSAEMALKEIDSLNLLDNS